MAQTKAPTALQSESLSDPDTAFSADSLQFQNSCLSSLFSVL